MTVTLVPFVVHTMFVVAPLGSGFVVGSIAVAILGDPCWSNSALRTCVPRPSFLQAPWTPWLMVPLVGALCRSGKLAAPTSLETRLGATLRPTVFPGKVVITCMEDTNTCTVRLRSSHVADGAPLSSDTHIRQTVANLMNGLAYEHRVLERAQDTMNNITCSRIVDLSLMSGLEV